MFQYFALIVLVFSSVAHGSGQCPPAPSLKGHKGNLQAVVPIFQGQQVNSQVKSDDYTAREWHYPRNEQGAYYGYSVLGGNVEHIRRQEKDIEILTDMVVETQERMQRHKVRRKEFEAGITECNHKNGQVFNFWIDTTKKRLDATDEILAGHRDQLQTAQGKLAKQRSTLDHHASVIVGNAKLADANHARNAAAIAQLDSSMKQHEQVLQGFKTTQAYHARSLADPKIFVGKKSKTGKQVASFQGSIKQQLSAHQALTEKIASEQAQHIKQQQEQLALQQNQIAQLQKQNKQNRLLMKCALCGLGAYAAWTSWVAYT